MCDTDAIIRTDVANTINDRLKDALQILKDTPLFEGADEFYRMAIEEAQALDIQMAKDHEVLREMHEKNPRTVNFQLEKLRKLYIDLAVSGIKMFRCAKSGMTRTCSAAMAKLRSRLPQSIGWFLTLSLPIFAIYFYLQLQSVIAVLYPRLRRVKCNYSTFAHSKCR
ncbi:unnamed protein product [Strongylus vulgaris]|uniref:Uncharacterized protein n=1 Tax=Strongylus vulgaris TaxID=40348 RepID=A0A3P7L329_STRVU|nr:unnamed protein product [Strongylus vulgaris]